MQENRVLFLPVNILTMRRDRFLGYTTLPCVLMTINITPCMLQIQCITTDDLGKIISFHPGKSGMAVQD